MAEMPTSTRTPAGRAHARSGPGKKLWAIACVVGFTGFFTYGFIGLAGIFGERPVEVMTFILCLLGLALGVLGWNRVARYTPKMHGRRAAARARLEEEYRASGE